VARDASPGVAPEDTRLGSRNCPKPLSRCEEAMNEAEAQVSCDPRTVVCIDADCQHPDAEHDSRKIARHAIVLQGIWFGVSLASGSDL
jgi:hypothetical protein